MAAIADLSLIAGHARRSGPSSCGWRRGRRPRARARACSTRVEVGEVHTAHGVALAAHGRRAEALARARAGRLPAPAVGAAARSRRRADRARAAVAAVGDRTRAAALFDEAEALLAGCRGPGRAAGAARRGPAAAAAARRGGADLSERELTVLRLLSGGLSEREIAPRAVPLLQHGAHPRQVDLPQARGLVARRGGRRRARARRPNHLGDIRAQVMTLPYAREPAHDDRTAVPRGTSSWSAARSVTASALLFEGMRLERARGTTVLTGAGARPGPPARPHRADPGARARAGVRQPDSPSRRGAMSPATARHHRPDPRLLGHAAQLGGLDRPLRGARLHASSRPPTRASRWRSRRSTPTRRRSRR